MLANLDLEKNLKSSLLLETGLKGGLCGALPSGQVSEKSNLIPRVSLLSAPKKSCLPGPG